jgi:low temperature requirement protein LtrA
MLFWKKPIMRQYFHKGLLWRAQEAQEVASYELFVDLFYVGIIAIAGDGAAEEATGQALLRFAVTFILSWKFWSDISQTISWFDADDIMRRITTLFILTCLLGLTVNIAGSREQTYTPVVSFYLASRWFVAAYYLWMAYLIPMVRAAMVTTAMCAFVTGLIWIGSIFVEDPSRQALIWIAIALDIFGPIVMVGFMRAPAWMGKRLQSWAKSHFDFTPGQNIEHKIERTNAFVTLVFGYSVVALLYQSAVPFGLNAFFGKAVLGLIQAFTFNWLYFEIDTFNMHTHAIRRHFFSGKSTPHSRLLHQLTLLTAVLWLSAHLPFILAFALSGSALSKLVLAHDIASANPSDLLEPYSTRSEEGVPTGLRWFYCGGLSIALMNMGVISLTHTFKTIPSVRLRRPFRLAIRFLVAIAILLLPLAGERLNSLQLVATTTGLVVLVLCVELSGSACVDDAFWGFNSGKRRCTYSARCALSRKEMSEKVKDGEIVNVEEVAKRDGFGGKEGFSV